MSQEAWYLQCRAEDVGDRAILVGDRGRVYRAAELLDDPRLLNEDRGLTTVTGGYRGQVVTVSAFGMGAPIAAVVLHELAALGVGAVVRLGTVMTVLSEPLGRFVLAEGALREEGTSDAYVRASFPAVPAHDLTTRIRARLEAADVPWTAGLVASYDGFYRDMFALSTTDKARIEDERARLAELGAVAMDMETSAVLTVGRVLGIAAASLCLATVDGATGDRLDADRRQRREQELLRLGLDGLADHPLPEPG